MCLFDGGRCAMRFALLREVQGGRSVPRSSASRSTEASRGLAQSAERIAHCHPIAKIQLKIYLLANDISRCTAAEVLHVRLLLLRPPLPRPCTARRARKVGAVSYTH